jgi:transposase InsO family protein
MCRAIGLAERTYYAARARPPSARQLADEVLVVHIRRVWEASYRAYGARRIWLALRRADIDVARCQVERLMAAEGLRGVQRGSKQRTTTPDLTAVRPPDLVERRFVAEAPNELWLADITYASTWEGWLYVSFILDCYSRMIVGWQIRCRRRQLHHHLRPRHPHHHPRPPHRYGHQRLDGVRRPRSGPLCRHHRLRAQPGLVGARRRSVVHH